MIISASGDYTSRHMVCPDTYFIESEERSQELINQIEFLGESKGFHELSEITNPLLTRPAAILTKPLPLT